MSEREEKGLQPEHRPGRWLKLSFSCPVALLEAAEDLLSLRSGGGVEQRPEEGGSCRLSGFFYLDAAGEKACQALATALVAENRSALAELFQLYQQPLPELHQELLADEDWSTSWQQHFKTFTIAPGLVIRPSWESYSPSAEERVLELDPGMAFGTGQHATTQGALRLIRRAFLERVPTRVLDVGTGTGILAMGAALWGAAEVLAIDNDPEAVRTARENVRRNGLEGQVRVAGTPLAELGGSFDLVCANIVHDVLVAMLPQLGRLVARPGHLVLAGILAGDQEHNLGTLYTRAGFRPCACEYEEEWVSLLLAR